MQVIRSEERQIRPRAIPETASRAAVRKRDAQSAEPPCDLHDRPYRPPDPSPEQEQRRGAWRTRRRPHWPEHDAPRAPTAFTTLDIERPLIPTNSIVVTVEQTGEPQGNLQHALAPTGG